MTERREPYKAGPDESTTKDVQEICLLFLADQLNQQQAARDGYAAGVRWLCLREELQEKYLNEAKELVSSWWQDEKSAEQKRNDLAAG